MDAQKGLLIVITGPGSVGKDAMATRLLKRHPEIEKVITTTSRTPRPWEKNHIDYHFVTNEEFAKMIEEQKLLEHVYFSGSHYGTAKEALRPFLEGKNMLWKVEITRGAQIKELFEQYFPDQADELLKKTKVIYIDVPNWDVLRERLKARGMTDEMIEERLNQDKRDWEMYKGEFGNIVINEPEKLDKTVQEVETLISS